jgi:hypothetical protein
VPLSEPILSKTVTVMRYFSSIFVMLAAVISVTAKPSVDSATHLSAKRDFNTILLDGIKIIGDLNDLMAKLQAFQGAVPDALAVLNSTDTLNNDLQATANAVADTPSLTDDQGNLLASTIASLATPIYNVLDLLQSKRPQFQAVAGGIPTGSIVLGRLQTLKNTTDAFASNLVPKLPTNLRRVAPLLSSDIDYHFIRAIQLYNQFF